MDQKFDSIDKNGNTTVDIISLKANPISESNSDNPKKAQAIGEIDAESSPVTPFTRVGNVLPDNVLNSGFGAQAQVPYRVISSIQPKLKKERTPMPILPSYTF